MNTVIFLHVLQMSLRPMIKADGRPVRPSPAKGEVYEAVTNYRVMTDNGSAALVECCPETGLCSLVYFDLFHMLLFEANAVRLLIGRLA